MWEVLLQFKKILESTTEEKKKKKKVLLENVEVMIQHRNLLQFRIASRILTGNWFLTGRNIPVRQSQIILIPNLLHFFCGEKNGCYWWQAVTFSFTGNRHPQGKTGSLAPA